MQRIWERDKNRTYYKDRPEGSDGYKMFLQDYGDYAKRLFDSAPITKLSIEITESKWPEYVNAMMNFTNLSYIDSLEATFPNGTYFNHELNQTIDIVQDRFIVSGIANKSLIAKSANLFYLHDLPVIIHFEYDRLIVTGEQLCDRWTTRGTEYMKVR